MSDEEKKEKERAERCLREALSGTASKSKNSLIKEALEAIGKIK